MSISSGRPLYTIECLVFVFFCSKLCSQELGCIAHTTEPSFPMPQQWVILSWGLEGVGRVSYLLKSTSVVADLETRLLRFIALMKFP